MAREQEQFLNVVDRDTAERLWRDVIRPVRLGAEFVPLSAALGRVLAEDVISDVDVPSFDRSNVDGYALRAEDTFGAAEDAPRRLRLSACEISTGVVPADPVAAGAAVPIATGGMLPRGADAVLMVEHAHIEGRRAGGDPPRGPGKPCQLRRHGRGQGRARRAWGCLSHGARDGPAGGDWSGARFRGPPAFRGDSSRRAMK